MARSRTHPRGGRAHEERRRGATVSWVAGATDAGSAGLLQVSAQGVKSEVPVRCPSAHVQQAGQDFKRWHGGVSRGLTSLKLVVNAREDMRSAKKGVRRSQEGGGVRTSSSGLVEGLLRGAWGKQSGEARGSHARVGSGSPERAWLAACVSAAGGPSRRRPAVHLLIKWPPDPLRQRPGGKEERWSDHRGFGRGAAVGVLLCRSFPGARGGVDSWREWIQGGQLGRPAEPHGAWGAGRGSW